MPDQNNPANDGGLGEVLRDTGSRSSVADSKLIARAVRERWPIDLPKKQRIVTTLMQILDTDTYEVEKIESNLAANGEASGPPTTTAKVTMPNHRNQVAAARTLAIMVGQNQEDEHHADNLEAKHKEIDARKTIILDGVSWEEFHALPERKVIPNEAQ